MQLSLAESIADYYVEKANVPEIEEYRSVQRSIVNRYWEDFVSLHLPTLFFILLVFFFLTNLKLTLFQKSYIDKNVCVPLNRLLRMFSSPNHLIQKRNDKLLDYDNCSSKLEKCKDTNKLKIVRGFSFTFARSFFLFEKMSLNEDASFQLKDEKIAARNNYEALNLQLLDELPTMTELANDLIKCCLSAFINARKRLIGRIARKIFPLMDVRIVVVGNKCAISILDERHRIVLDT